METEKLYEKGCFVQLSIQCWTGAKRINKKTAIDALGSEWARANKDIIDPEKLKPMEAIRSKAIKFLDAFTLPTPIRGLRIVSFESIEILDKTFQEYQEEMKEEVEKFNSEYPELRELAKETLLSLYNESDYPKDITNKFGIEWRFFTISAPENTSLLSPELVRKEQEKFMETMRETKEMGVLALRQEMKELLEQAIDKLVPNKDGSIKRIFKSTMKENFVEFFETFKSRNIFEDSELSKILEQAKDIIDGVEVDLLKSDEEFREVVKEEMTSVSSLLFQCMENTPSRKLKL